MILINTMYKTLLGAPSMTLEDFLELPASAWLFGINDDYLMGKREQGPIYAAQANLVKRIRPGLWASLDLSAFRGGGFTRSVTVAIINSESASSP